MQTEIVTASGEQFGTGTGAQQYYRLTCQGLSVRAPVEIDELYLDDWQSTIPLSPNQRTNLLKSSQDFTQTIWGKSRLTVSENATTAPDGTATGTKIVETTDNGGHYLDQTVKGIDVTQPYTRSIYVKADERTFVILFTYSSTINANYGRVSFNLNSGAFSNATIVNGSQSYSARQLDDGWWRISLTASFSEADVGLICRTMVGESTTVYNYAGDGVSGIYVWGEQLESDQSATRYIETQAASVSVTDYVVAGNGLIYFPTPPANATALSWDGSGAIPVVPFVTSTSYVSSLQAKFVGTASDFLQAFLKLLPRGRIWSRDPDAVQNQVLLGLNTCYEENVTRANQLLVDAFPATTSELLPEWESTLGLPDPCAGESPTVQQRVRQVVTRLTATGGQSIPYMIAFARTLGYDVSVTQFSPFRAGQSVAGDACCSDDWAYVWQINAPTDSITYFAAGQSAAGEALATWGNDVLECELSAIKPAHTILNFAYYQEDSNVSN